MTPYYPTRDGYPSMFEPDTSSGAAAGETNLDLSFVERLLANRLPVPGSPARVKRLRHLAMNGSTGEANARRRMPCQQ